jgi:hypothetical protein
MDTLKDKVIAVVKEYQKSGAFAQRVLTDTPTDALSVVNRKYITLNGPSASRPTSSVIGQHYFDTSLASGRGKPVWWNGTGFVDATGTYV